ncbi:4866_t:CDS:1 [Paraglomus brasilianum]|uniref:4866_t:CDS:1 n=1 Tax=Paraglomus brasilianum TaxID=144538 RepID=A0A9N9DNM3_9GLOM|nr:4866_t:CDS:1 [Paraglomus brasilianum]
MGFPFQIIDVVCGKQNKLGRFRDPPTSTREEDYQSYFIEACAKLPAACLYVEDTHLIPILCTRKPDCVGLEKDQRLDPLNVEIIFEIKPKQTAYFSDEDVGNIAFTEKLLQLQPQ